MVYRNSVKIMILTISSEIERCIKGDRLPSQVWRKLILKHFIVFTRASLASPPLKILIKHFYHWQYTFTEKRAKYESKTLSSFPVIKFQNLVVNSITNTRKTHEKACSTWTHRLCYLTQPQNLVRIRNFIFWHLSDKQGLMDHIGRPEIPVLYLGGLHTLKMRTCIKTQLSFRKTFRSKSSSVHKY